MCLTTPLSANERAALVSALTVEGRVGALTLERSKLVALGFLRHPSGGGFQITKIGRLKLRIDLMNSRYAQTSSLHVTQESVECAMLTTFSKPPRSVDVTVDRFKSMVLSQQLYVSTLQNDDSRLLGAQLLLRSMQQTLASAEIDHAISDYSIDPLSARANREVGQ